MSNRPNLLYQRTGEIGCQKHGFSMTRGKIPHERCVACDLDAELNVGVDAFELAAIKIADLEARLAACEQENVALRELLREVDETILRMAGKLTTKIREALK